MYISSPIINPAHSNVCAYDIGLVLSSPTRTKSSDLSELLPSLIISRAFPPISSIVLPVPYTRKYTSAKRAADWDDRFREHLRDVEINDKDASKPVARHFNLPNHSLKHMAVCGLSLHLSNTESRKNIEQKFIFQIGTLSPCGINERFSFL